MGPYGLGGGQYGSVWVVWIDRLGQSLRPGMGEYGLGGGSAVLVGLVDQ